MPFLKGHKNYNTGKSWFKKGNIPWNKNTKTGLKPWLGKTRSKKTKKKISKKIKLLFKNGYIHPFLNKHHSFSAKNKIREKIKRAYSLGKVNGMWGKHHSEKTRKILSKKHIGKFCQEKHPNWKGGVTPEYRKSRKGLKLKLWREKVFKRDDYTCQKTKIKGGKLCSHHIQNFSQFPELRFMVKNGITLSRKSHDNFHKIYGKKNNTKEQLKEFLNN